ncbi:hypothetical protein ACHHYP_09552 [Achlya hypogyna]|uniref:Secreted protein n=1 Tax=Achlya hypogyna TaxID=1202772 RepID=A0A0A7CMU9_ACHHY|nr:secreted protein [Achlya hypogyna]OQR87068.1 hypothetical protein ACHHYP_09552 [Achlya hypogyna]
MFRLAKLVSALVAATALAGPAPLNIGADNAISVTADGSKPVSQIIERSGATYISLHFASVNLPKGASVMVTSLDGSKKVEITGSHSDYFTETIDADRVVLTYTAPSYDKADSNVFVLDKFVSGTGGPKNVLESICGTDNSKPSVCYADSDKAKRTVSTAVARLLINGRSLCTGWLIGSEGHMMTNWHCIKTADDAKNVQVEFGAECSKCDDPLNDKQLACAGTKVASDVEYIVSDRKNDFALVKLKLKDGVDLKQYGYLKIRTSGPVLGEEVYVPQHPNGNPRRLAIVSDDGKPATITALDGGSCYDDITDKDYVGHQLDTQGGSSGSPMVSAKDNVVVALHNCGGCNNGGIKMNRIVDFLKAQGIPLPKDATTDVPPPPTSAPTSAPTISPTTAPPTPAGNTINFCSISNRVISEYYQGLYQDSSKDNQNEKFVYDAATGAIQAQSNKECLDAYLSDGGFKLHTWACDSSNPNQKWTVANNQIVHRTHNVCVTSVVGTTDIALAACNGDDIRQQFTSSCPSKDVRSYMQLRTKRGKYISEWNSGLYADTSRSNRNELFEWDAANQWIKVLSNGECFDAYKDGNGNGHLHTYACSTTNANQKWIIANGKIRHATHANMCIDVDPNDGSHKVQVWECSEGNNNQVIDVLKF